MCVPPTCINTPLCGASPLIPGCLHPWVGRTLGVLVKGQFQCVWSNNHNCLSWPHFNICYNITLQIDFLVQIGNQAHCLILLTFSVLWPPWERLSYGDCAQTPQGDTRCGFKFWFYSVSTKSICFSWGPMGVYSGYLVWPSTRMAVRSLLLLLLLSFNTFSLKTCNHQVPCSLHWMCWRRFQTSMWKMESQCKSKNWFRPTVQAVGCLLRSPAELGSVPTFSEIILVKLTSWTSPYWTYTSTLKDVMHPTYSC